MLSVPWLVYRREYWLAIPPLVVLLVVGIIPFVNVVVSLVVCILLGLRADRIVLERAWRVANKALGQFGPGDEATRAAKAAGGVSTVGLALVVMWIPLYGFALVLSLPTGRSGSKSRGYEAQMKSDLRFLRASEENFFVDSGRYAKSIDRLVTVTANGVTIRFASMPGVSTPTLVFTSDSTYSATVTHAKAPGVICGLGVGVPNPVDPSVADSMPACRR
jgi:hypothetical protein